MRMRVEHIVYAVTNTLIKSLLVTKHCTRYKEASLWYILQSTQIILPKEPPYVDIVELCCGGLIPQCAISISTDRFSLIAAQIWYHTSETAPN